MKHKIYSSPFTLTCGMLLCALLSACATQPSESVPKQQVINYSKSDADYFSLVQKIKSGNAQATDFDKIIKLYPLTSLYEPSSDFEQTAKLLSQNHIRNGSWQACLQLNEDLLELNFTSLTGLYGAAICSAESNQRTKSALYHSILDGFIEAIWRSGSGLTKESPLLVSSVNDLYAFVQLHQMIAVGQSLEYVDKLPVQAIKVKNPQNNRTSTWYFDVTAQFRKAIIDKLEAQP